MGSITFKNVFKHYKGEPGPIVKDFNLHVEEGEFLVIVGPSGCGKSTTLRMLAGLEEITAGELYINERLINYVSPKSRDIAMVFQNYALYPNLSVFENMALGLKLRKTARYEIELRVNRAARILEIAHLLDKTPGALSGGQKQRVALGRVIVREPEVFLMDEPLSNLDAKLRSQTRAEIIKLHESLRTTTVYVTHDQVEAMTMGSRIVVMKDGVIQQVAPPAQIYEQPVNRFVAGFIGSPQMNFFPGGVVRRDGILYFENKRMQLKLPDELIPLVNRDNGEERDVELGLRPEQMQLLDEETQDGSQGATVEAEVLLKELMGADAYVHLSAGEYGMIVRADPYTSIVKGDKVRVRFNMGKAHLFSRSSGESLRYAGERKL